MSILYGPLQRTVSEPTSAAEGPRGNRRPPAPRCEIGDYFHTLVHGIHEPVPVDLSGPERVSTCPPPKQRTNKSGQPSAKCSTNSTASVWAGAFSKRRSWRTRGSRVPRFTPPRSAANWCGPPVYVSVRWRTACSGKVSRAAGLSLWRSSAGLNRQRSRSSFRRSTWPSASPVAPCRSAAAGVPRIVTAVGRRRRPARGEARSKKVIDAARSAWAGSRVVVHCETARTPGLPSRSYVARVFVQKSAKRRTFESRPEDLFRAARLFGKFVDEVLRTDPRTWWVRWGLDRCEYSFSAINDDHVKAMRRRLVLPADRLLELNRACDAVRAIEFPHGEKLEGVRDLRSLAEANGLGTDGLFQPARLAHVEGRVEREVQTMDAAAAREHGACTLTLIRQLLQRVADGTLRFSRDDDWLSQARRRQPQPLQPPGLEAPPTQYGPLSIETAAKILSCDRSTLYRWMQDGRCGKKGGPSPLERKQSVEDGTGGRSGNRYYLIESRLDAEAQLRLGEHKAKVSQKFGRGGVDPSAKPNE